MILIAARIGLGLLLLGALGVGALVLREPRMDVAPVGDAATPVSPVSSGLSSSGLLALARRTTPFRIGGKPPVERYGAPSPVVGPPALPVPKPALVLTGLVLGREPAALLEGLPGIEGPVVARPGQSIGALRVMSVDSAGVVIRGMDTTWTLRVRRPWN